MSGMQQFDSDWELLKAGMDELETYILSPVLYWPISHHKPDLTGETTRLTIGNLLLSLKRIKSTDREEPCKAEVAKFDGEVNRIREKWRSNWSNKAEVEIRSRLDLWTKFVANITGEPGEYWKSYPYHVRQRVILELLSVETLAPSPQYESTIAGLDARLRAISLKGQFVWDASLINGFPADTFWYLYSAAVKR
jgi:hypothetical protein